MNPKTGKSSNRCTIRKDKLAARRERDRARRQAKRTVEVWAMPADEVPTEEKGSCSILEHMGRGPFYQVVAVVDGLLCGLVGKIVARLEENCKRLWAASSTGRALGVACVI